MRSEILVAFSTMLLLIISCNSEKNETSPLVSVYDNTLYLEDVKHQIPPDITKEDSVILINSLINDWISQQTILHFATNNISDEKLEEIARKVESYKNDLISFEYETKLVSQSIDTSISEEEILTYYNEHQKDFILKDYLTKVLYVKLPKQISSIDKAKMDKWYHLYNQEQDMANILKFCKSNGFEFYYNDSSWVYFDKVLEQIPLENVDKLNFIKWIKKTTTSDSIFNYYLNVYDYKLKDAISPLEFEQNKIKSILLNIRANQTLKEIKKEILDEAWKKNKIKDYCNSKK